jgi:hypothetical protein
MMIRTQDRKDLVPLGKVGIEKGNEFFLIRNYPFVGAGTDCGHYASEARCLEVLDEIQNDFRYTNHFSGCGINSFDCQSWECGVYQMPEK